MTIPTRITATPHQLVNVRLDRGEWLFPSCLGQRPALGPVPGWPPHHEDHCDLESVGSAHRAHTSDVARARRSYAHQLTPGIERSALLKGLRPPKIQGQKSWSASFDWLIDNDTNAVKINEGKYLG